MTDWLAVQRAEVIERNRQRREAEQAAVEERARAAAEWREICEQMWDEAVKFGWI